MTTLSSSEAWITRSRSRPLARLRLFCFPYAGGGASIFRSWAERLPDAVEVCPVQLPGREGRLGEAPFTRLAPLIQTLALVLQPYLDMPFAFFGHSMGALVSFELARLLQKQASQSPQYLLVSAYGAPQLPGTAPSIYHLPDAAFLEEIRRLEGTPEQILQNPELMQLLMPTLRADFELCGTYNYMHGEPLDCPISAFGGIQDAAISRKELEAWRAQTRRAFQLRMFFGNHFFIHSAQQSLLQAITQDLSQLLLLLARENVGTL
jgi:medium-chain acyl-[acyl-carrier-protein] hydrolase